MRNTVKRFALPVIATALVLSACAREETWQVVAVYTDPDTPGALPVDAAGAVNVAVDGSSFHGTTGCAEMSGTYAIDKGVLTVTDVDMPDAGGCVGGARRTHDQLAGLLSPGARFDVHQLSDYEVVLTAVVEAIEPPSLRLMLL